SSARSASPAPGAARPRGPGGPGGPGGPRGSGGPRGPGSALPGSTRLPVAGVATTAAVGRAGVGIHAVLPALGQAGGAALLAAALRANLRGRTRRAAGTTIGGIRCHIRATRPTRGEPSEAGAHPAHTGVA